ncbi:MAG: DUF3109 family protein [Bacteroidota bacterium]
MFVIGEVTVTSDIATANFACDLSACRGACCCISGRRGAPLEDEEIHEIEKVYPAVAKYLSEKHREMIGESGPYEGTPGDYTTTCVEDRECVFVTYDGPVAKCAFEKAYLNGEIEWRKPISCHLFPIRVKKSGDDVLWYELNNECSPAVERGNREQIPLTEFLRDALIRKYGEVRYEQLGRKISTIRCAS